MYIYLCFLLINYMSAKGSWHGAAGTLSTLLSRQIKYTSQVSCRNLCERITQDLAADVYILPRTTLFIFAAAHSLLPLRFCRPSCQHPAFSFCLPLSSYALYIISIPAVFDLKWCNVPFSLLTVQGRGYTRSSIPRYDDTAAYGYI